LEPEIPRKTLAHELIFLFLFLVISASETSRPELEVRVDFPPDNPTSLVYNGQQNRVLVTVSNYANQDLLLESVGGSFKQLGKKQKHLRDTSPLSYGLQIPRMVIDETSGEPSKPSTFSIPYQFHAEFPTGEIGLTIWAKYSDADGNKFEITAFDDIVTIAEPPTTWFDPALLFAYVLVTGILSAAGYLIYNIFVVPSMKTKKRSKKSTIPKKTDSVEPENTEGKSYEESWIPEHHLRSNTPKLRKRKSQGGGLTSASETEASGTEGIRKSRK